MSTDIDYSDVYIYGTYLPLTIHPPSESRLANSLPASFRLSHGPKQLGESLVSGGAGAAKKEGASI
jgi:hypothetical protein